MAEVVTKQEAIDEIVRVARKLDKWSFRFSLFG
jgi:hypothetical protein